MTTSPDCRDGRHDACDASGGCRDCECHFAGLDLPPYLPEREIFAAQWREYAAEAADRWQAASETPDFDDLLTPQPVPVRVHVEADLWDTWVPHRRPAQHATQPRGLARLMSEPPARSVIVSATVLGLAGVFVAGFTTGQLL